MTDGRPPLGPRHQAYLSYLTNSVRWFIHQPPAEKTKFRLESYCFFGTFVISSSGLYFLIYLTTFCKTKFQIQHTTPTVFFFFFFFLTFHLIHSFGVLLYCLIYLTTGLNKIPAYWIILRRLLFFDIFLYSSGAYCLIYLSTGTFIFRRATSIGAGSRVFLCWFIFCLIYYLTTGRGKKEIRSSRAWIILRRLFVVWDIYCIFIPRYFFPALSSIIMRCWWFIIILFSKWN
jgi:hypothetical protein